MPGKSDAFRDENWLFSTLRLLIGITTSNIVAPSPRENLANSRNLALEYNKDLLQFLWKSMFRNYWIKVLEDRLISTIFRGSPFDIKFLFAIFFFLIEPPYVLSVYGCISSSSSFIAILDTWFSIPIASLLLVATTFVVWKTTLSRK